MFKLSLKDSTISCLTGAIIGLIAFVIIYGTHILHPTNIDWLMDGGDAMQHYVGWQFFRYETWHIPLGFINNYQTPLGTTVVYTDSIPLLALFFKLFNTLLPEQFQYFGIWMLCCYLLQGLFACLLIRVFTKNILIQTLAAGFFVLSPIMAFRATGHHALMAHWLILASLFLYFQDYKRSVNLGWTAIILISALVHAYMMLMAVVLWLAFLVKSSKTYPSLHNKDLLWPLAFNFIALFIVMWLAGYFTVSSQGLNGGGYGIYSLNLLALFEPLDWSRFMQPFALATPGQYEGFNYLGFGMLFLLVLALYQSLHTTIDTKTKIVFKPLLYTSLLLTLFAISTTVSIGSLILLHIHIPPFIKHIAEIYRSSGRIFWPVYYLLFMIVIATLIKTNTQKVIIGILSITLIIQIADLSVGLKNTGMHVNHYTNYTSLLKSPLWNKWAQHYHKIYVVPQVWESPDYATFAELAAPHHMGLNIASLARRNPHFTNQAIQLLIDFKNCNWKSDTLYIIADKALLKTTRFCMHSGDQMFKVDGYYVLAPALN